MDIHYTSDGEIIEGNDTGVDNREYEPDHRIVNVYETIPISAVLLGKASARLRDIVNNAFCGRKQRTASINLVVSGDAFRLLVGWLSSGELEYSAMDVEDQTFAEVYAFAEDYGVSYLFLDHVMDELDACCSATYYPDGSETFGTLLQIFERSSHGKKCLAEIVARHMETMDDNPEHCAPEIVRLAKQDGEMLALLAEALLVKNMKGSTDEDDPCELHVHGDELPCYKDD